jgi:hypothetical protein
MLISKRWKKMGKNTFQKGFVIGAVALLATMALFHPVTTSKNVADLNSGTLGEKEGGESDEVTFTFAVRPVNQIRTLSISRIDNIDYKNSHTIYEVKLSKEEARDVNEKIKSVDAKFATVDKFDELEKIAKEKLKILRDFELLPPSFTLENLSQLTGEIGEEITIRHRDKANPPVATSNWTPGYPFIGVGPSVFAYICPWGTVKPLGISPAGLIAVNITPIIKINIHMNYTGIYVNSTGPIIKDRSLKIQGPMWKSIWTKNDSWVNFTEMHLVGFYYGELIIGHTVAFGFAYPDIMNLPKVRPIKGSFWYLGIFPIPISFTLYQTWPEPWTVIIDAGIVPSLFASVIIPFWFPVPR